MGWPTLLSRITGPVFLLCNHILILRILNWVFIFTLHLKLVKFLIKLCSNCYTVSSFETVGYLGHWSWGFGQTSAPRYLHLVLLAVNSPIIVAIELYTRK